MRALVMSVMSLARTVALRSDSRVRTRAASIVSWVRTEILGSGTAKATAGSIVNLSRAAVARAGVTAQAGRATAVRLGRAVVARAGGTAQAGRATVVRLGRAAAARAAGPAQACAALAVRLAGAVASHTEGVRAQVYLAFTLSFLLAMIVGTMVLSLGPRTYRTAAPLAPEPRASSAPVTRTVDPLPGLPSVSLPRLADPSKRAEEAARLLNTAPAGRTPAAVVVVRSSAGARSEVAKVREIALWGNPNKPWVSITASAPVRYQLRNVEPDWVVIDVSRAELALTSGKPPAGRGLVRLIRVGQFTPDTVRVVLELTEAVPIHVATSPGKNAIVVSLAVDARGNSRTEPTPGQRPGAARPVPVARAASLVAGT